MLFIAAVVQGWNQTATSGSDICWLNSLIRSEPVRQDTEGCVLQSGDNLKYAAISAAAFLFAPIGCLVSDPLNELFWGRRKALIASASLIFASAISGAFVKRWWQLLICRAILGVGMGCKAAVTPVFAAEIAPPHLRGSLVMNWQVFDALGIFFGYSANLLASTQGAHAWRWQIASSAIPAALLLWSLVMITWDSPRFLMKHEEKRRQRYLSLRAAWRAQFASLTTRHEFSFPEDQKPEVIAYDSSELSLFAQLRHTVRCIFGVNPALPYQSHTFDTLVALRGSQLLAAKELILTHCQLLLAAESTKSSSKPASADMDFSLTSSSQWFRRLYEIFTIAHMRREFYAAAVVNISQQLCGINVLIFYSARLFNPDGHDQYSRAPLFLSWGIGICNFLFALPAYWLIETRGRRWLLLTTLPFMALCMACAAGCFQIQDDQVRTALVGAFTFLFTIFYSPGMGPVPFTLSAEMFPLEHRMVGMSMAVLLLFLTGGLFALFEPLIKNGSILLGVFAALNIVAYVLVWIFVREVAAVSVGDGSGESRSIGLEEMSRIFKFSTKRHISYQWNRRGDAWKSIGHFLRGRPTPVTEANDFYRHETTRIAQKERSNHQD